jgi:hypothetical protein
MLKEWEDYDPDEPDDYDPDDYEQCECKVCPCFHDVFNGGICDDCLHGEHLG